MHDIEDNKKTVVAYYEAAFSGQPEKAVADYMGPTYIQHNPEADDGAAAFIKFVHGIRAANPELRLDIKRVIAEGNLVMTHAHLILKHGQPGLALADIFRIENGKVVEHWDVIQPVPKESANANGMF